MPVPAIAAAVLRGAAAAREAQAALAAERGLAKRLATQAAAKGLSDKAESLQRLAKRVKQLKRIGWLIKGVTLGTSSIGDVFISLWVLLLWANAEMLLFPLFVPGWKQEWWEKAFTIMLDLIIFMVIGTVVGLVAYFYYNPAEACSILGPAVAGPLLGSLGLLGGCELFGTAAQTVQ